MLPEHSEKLFEFVGIGVRRDLDGLHEFWKIWLNHRHIAHLLLSLQLLIKLSCVLETLDCLDVALELKIADALEEVRERQGPIVLCFKVFDHFEDLLVLLGLQM